MLQNFFGKREVIREKGGCITFNIKIINNIPNPIDISSKLCYTYIIYKKYNPQLNVLYVINSIKYYLK